MRIAQTKSVSQKTLVFSGMHAVGNKKRFPENALKRHVCFSALVGGVSLYLRGACKKSVWRPTPLVRFLCAGIAWRFCFSRWVTLLSQGYASQAGVCFLGGVMLLGSGYASLVGGVRYSGGMCEWAPQSIFWNARSKKKGLLASALK